MAELIDVPDGMLDDEPVVVVAVAPVDTLPDGDVAVPVDDGVIGGAPVPDEVEPMVEVVGFAGEVTVWSLAVPGRMEGEPAVVELEPVAVGRSPVCASAGVAARAAATRQAVAGFSIVFS